MEQLQHPLAFVHKFNLYKLSGLLIEDGDLRSIARVYGVSLEELKKVDEGFQRNKQSLLRICRRSRIHPKMPGCRSASGCPGTKRGRAGAGRASSQRPGSGDAQQAASRTSTIKDAATQLKRALRTL